VVTELRVGEVLATWLPEIPDWVWDATEMYHLLPGYLPLEDENDEQATRCAPEAEDLEDDERLLPSER
jgi:hypothetical protein